MKKNASLFWVFLVGKERERISPCRPIIGVLAKSCVIIVLKSNKRELNGEFKNSLFFLSGSFTLLSSSFFEEYQIRFLMKMEGIYFHACGCWDYLLYEFGIRFAFKYCKFSKLILESEPCNAPLFFLPSCLSAAYTWVLLQRFLFILPLVFVFSCGWFALYVYVFHTHASNSYFHV